MAQTEFPLIGVTTLRARLGERAEIALIDIREAGEFGGGHALLAVNLPWSTLEQRARRLIPRRATPVVIQDADGGERGLQAARRLRQLGYGDVAIAEGGLAAWQQAGHALFHGVNVPSKAFSEWVEHQAHTPSLSAEAVFSRQQRGEPLLLLDGRTPQEFAQHHIPGAVNCPNGELIPWLAQQPLPDDLPVVITCAGRTRGIIGAQSLIDAGVKQPVAALAGGTQAWRIAGLPLTGSEPLAAWQPLAVAPAAAALNTAAIPWVNPAQLQQWRADSTRTTLLFDVRSREEYLAGTLPGAIHLPGGQLLQTLDEQIATRGARLVLFDPQGSRDGFAAWWLHQLGWPVYRWQGQAELLPPAVAADELPALFPGIRTLSAAAARANYTAEVQLLSADRSALHLQQHVAGARWINRAALDALVSTLSRDQPLWIFAADAQLALGVAWDLATTHDITALVIGGDAADWQRAGWRCEADDPALSEAQRLDFLFWLHDRHSGNLQASRDYLAWEAQLPDAVAREGLHGFRRLTSSDLISAAGGDR